LGAGAAGAQNANPAGENKDAKNLADSTKAKKRHSLSEEGGSGGGSSGSSSGDSSSGSSSTSASALLAQLMGGGSAASEGTSGSAGSQILELSDSSSKSKNPKSIPNIFQYATFRFRKHVSDGFVLKQSKSFAKNFQQKGSLRDLASVKK
jgi:hypothetical protein